MEPISSRFTAITHAPLPLAPPANALHARIGALYARSQKDRALFGSPLGPFHFDGQPGWLPRFVFFGPQASDESWRLAFLAGFDHRDLRPAQALLGFVERLAEHAEQGHGLNLAFFPLVDAAGLTLAAPPRHLAAAHWLHDSAPEIGLLEKDARLRGYHGFVRIETAAPGEDILTIRVREPAEKHPTPDVELISTEEIDPFPVRFELGARGVLPGNHPVGQQPQHPGVRRGVGQPQQGLGEQPGGPPGVGVEVEGVRQVVEVRGESGRSVLAVEEQQRLDDRADPVVRNGHRVGALGAAGAVDEGVQGVVQVQVQALDPVGELLVREAVATARRDQQALGEHGAGPA